MANNNEFVDLIEQGYRSKGESITLGAAMLGDETLTGSLVNIPLKTINRHGLISGATGTGKTKTLQVFAENLSEKGIPVLLMDLKGDLSGLAKPSPGHPKIDERHEKIGIPFEAKGFPVEILTISEQDGTRLRATVSEFGPVLLSRILGLSEVQEGILAILFQYCDDKQLGLLDLKDLKKMLQYATQEGKAELEASYGRISTASTGSILRKIVALEQQGAEMFFGERSFDVMDLCRLSDDGRGIISVLRLTDVQDKPQMFSTFMLQLLAEVYNSFPELGDSDRPELVLFIDEAHLVFENASKSLLDQLESIVKLIRSKGIGIYFVTQNPKDIPSDVLSQLGLKIQHALRAFTAKDRKAIKLAAENYPDSDYYDTATVLTELGIGEALVSALNEKGVPTPLVKTMLRAPMSRMDVLTGQELDELIRKSSIASRYNEIIDSESAYEILNEKIHNAQQKAEESKKESTQKKSARRSGMNPVLKVVTSAAFIRGVFGILNKVLRK
ncbi:helicase HerA-like domain-containing protein [Lutimonas vermicola]|uniref:Helicase HerA-like domain-containing protein n=1 Tax=Lutimonas vermicola TaxID=414288 RepID=A0ABU9KVN6_9FLAO